MRISDHVRDCAVFIGLVNDRGNFVPYGTGVCVLFHEYGWGFPYIVTARHVVKSIPGDIIYVRINTQSTILEIVPFPKRQTMFHPSHIGDGHRRKYIDVAALRIEFGSHHHDHVTWVTSEDFCSDRIIVSCNIGIGDEVIIAGAFFGHIGETRNIPIIRVGNIAAMPEEPVPTDYGFMDAYLIEARSIDGLSGSPVFVHLGLRPPVPTTTPIELIRTHYLIGLVQGHYVVQSSQEMVIRSSSTCGGHECRHCYCRAVNTDNRDA